MPNPLADPNYEPTLEELLGELRSIPFFILMMRPTDTWGQGPSFMDTLHRHLLWLRDLELRGALLASGPVDQPTWDGTGMSIFRAASYEDAVAISESEPFLQAGFRSNHVHHWHVNEGTFNVSVSLFTGKISVS